MYCVSCLLVKEKQELQRDPVSKLIDPLAMFVISSI